MKLRDRYRRLTLWNKVAFWGSVCSIVGLLGFFVAPLLTQPSPAPTLVAPSRPVVAIDFAGTDIFIHNRGKQLIEDLKLYPILYTFGPNRKISNRNMTRGPTFTLNQLVPGQRLLVPKTNYLDVARYEAMRNPDKSAPNPILFAVLSYHRSEDYAPFCEMEPFITMFKDQGADPLMVFPLLQTDQASVQGNFQFFGPMIEEMRNYERNVFRVE